MARHAPPGRTPARRRTSYPQHARAGGARALQRPTGAHGATGAGTVPTGRHGLYSDLQGPGFLTGCRSVATGHSAMTGQVLTGVGHPRNVIPVPPQPATTAEGAGHPGKRKPRGRSNPHDAGECLSVGAGRGALTGSTDQGFQPLASVVGSGHRTTGGHHGARRTGWPNGLTDLGFKAWDGVIA